MYSKPTAIALAQPSSLPTNLTKRQVLRFPTEEDNCKESNVSITTTDDGGINKHNSTELEDIIQVKKIIDKEKRPLPKLPLEKTEKELISEIELAIYWDRHAYEFKPKLKRAISADTFRRLITAEDEQQQQTRKETVDIGIQKDLNEIQKVEVKDSFCQTANLRDKGCQCYCWKHLPHPMLIRSKSAAAVGGVPKLVKTSTTNTETDSTKIQNEEMNNISQTQVRHKCKHYASTLVIPNQTKDPKTELKKNLQRSRATIKFNTKPKLRKYPTEYAINFRNPFKIADSESRILQTKVLNRCFRHSMD